jgi:hypothetical protein
MPKSDSVAARIGWNVGYVYFTTDQYEAIMWGLHKSVVDSITRNIPEDTNRDPLVLAVKTSNLRDNIEIDPEVSMPEVQKIPNIRNGVSQWYRCKGDIKVKHLFPYKYLPFDYFDRMDSNIIKQIVKDSEMKHRSEEFMLKLNDLGFKFKDKDDLFKQFELDNSSCSFG